MSVVENPATKVVRRVYADTIQSARAWLASNRPLLHAARYVLEVVVMWGIVMRAAVYVIVHAGVDDLRRTNPDVWGERMMDADGVAELRCNYTGPAWTYPSQSDYELLAAAGLCTLVSYFTWTIGVQLPNLHPVVTPLIYANCGVLAAEPFYVTAWLAYTSD